MLKKLYNEDSIKSLAPREFVRLRPGIYCGSTEYSTQLLIEIVSNAVDEYKVGNCDKILVDIKEDNTFRVEDNGQGFLINSVRDDGKTILEAAFSVLNTSGKYDADGVYEGTALGLNGIGNKLVCYLTTESDVLTFRDNKYEHIWFKDGIFDKREVGDINHPSGTIVTWKPDKQFFDHVEINIDEIKNLFKVISCLCPGLTIELNNKGEKITYFSHSGINDLVDEATAGKEIINNRLNINFTSGKNKLDLVLTYTSDYSSTIVPYVNTGLTQSGQHITQLKTIITREINKYFRDKGWLKEKDANIAGEDCIEGAYIVFNLTAPDVAYDSQIKTRISKINMQPFSPVIAEELQYWMAANEKDVKKIAEKALAARRAREAARKARDAARGLKENNKNTLKTKMKLSDKFIDCGNQDAKDRTLLLVEGKSAAASAVEARNPKRDAIYMLRGKIVSPLRTSIEKILANQEMSDIIKVIGAGFRDTFDVSKMNFDKIVITSDAE